MKRSGLRADYFDMDSLKWSLSHKPLKPVGLVALNEATTMQILLDLAGERLSHLRGSYSDNSIILLGPEEILPWVPNALYLGKIGTTPNVLMPTHLSPNLPADWLGRAIKREFGSGQYAIDPVHRNIFNVSSAMNLSLKKLTELFNGAA